MCSILWVNLSLKVISTSTVPFTDLNVEPNLAELWLHYNVNSMDKQLWTMVDGISGPIHEIDNCQKNSKRCNMCTVQKGSW